MGGSAGMSMPVAPPMPPLRPGGAPWGCAAVLLPHHADGAVDWASFRTILGHTVDAGLTPAVNMDTGFVQLLDPATRAEVLTIASEMIGERAGAAAPAGFLAGAFVADRPGDPFALDRYRAELAAVQAAGVEHRPRIGVPDHDQVDPGRECVRRRPVGQPAPCGDADPGCVWGHGSVDHRTEFRCALPLGGPVRSEDDGRRAAVLRGMPELAGHG